MDFKRNARYFSQTFAKKMTVLSIVGAVVAVVGAIVWWYIYLGAFDIIVEVLAIAGAITAVGAFSQRPSEKYVFEQIESAKKRFSDEAMEVFGYPADAENCTRLVWGFVPGTVEKVTKESKKVTDRVEFALIWRKNGEIRVYRKVVSLLKEESEVTDTRLSLKELAITSDREAGLLTLSDTDESLSLTVFEFDFRLEEFLDEIAHRKGK